MQVVKMAEDVKHVAQRVNIEDPSEYGTNLRTEECCTKDKKATKKTRIWKNKKIQLKVT